MDIRVIIAAHKDYDMPEDLMYLPLQVGAEGKKSIGNVPKDQTLDQDPVLDKEGNPTDLYHYTRDNTGDHISDKNDCFCELTGMYWSWKNLNDDYVGLVHYRRHFSLQPKEMRRALEPMGYALSKEEAEGFLKDHDLIVPKKRKYYIESLYSHYAHTLDGVHLDVAKDIIAERYPEYLETCERMYKRTWGYMFNMSIMKKEDLDAYCTWLFDILWELQDRLEKAGKLENLTPFESRLFGRVSEVLFNVWLDKRIKEDGYKPAEVPVATLGSVPWVKKGLSFLAAKFFGKKYKASF